MNVILGFLSNEYVQLYIDYKLNKSVKCQFSAFSKGFYQVYSGKALELFTCQEFMTMALGKKEVNWEEWENVSNFYYCTLY